MQKYIKHLEISRKKNGAKLMDATIERYIQFISNYFVELESIKDLEKLVEAMNRFLVQRKNVILYSAFIHYLNYRGVDTDDSFGVHKKLKTVKKHENAFNSLQFLQSKVLSRSEVKAMLTEADTVMLRCLFSFMYDTACRRAEACQVKFKDVHVMRQSIDKERKYIESGIYAHVTINGKGGKYRTVVLYKNSFLLLLKLHGRKWVKDDHIFQFFMKDKSLYKDQEHALYMNMLKSSYAILDKKVNPHCLRHTRATHLADNNMPVTKLQKYLGHNDIATTMIYAHLTDKGGIEGVREFGFDIVEERE